MLSSLRRIYFIWLAWWWFWPCSTGRASPEGWVIENIWSQARATWRGGTSEWLTLRLLWTRFHSGRWQNQLLGNRPEQADLLPLNLYPHDPWGQIRETPALARGRGVEGEAMWRSRVGTELCKHGSHKPSPETLSCCLVSPPDGFIFRGLEYIRFSGDPAQVSDLEEAKFSKLLHTMSFLCCNSCKFR